MINIRSLALSSCATRQRPAALSKAGLLLSAATAAAMAAANQAAAAPADVTPTPAAQLGEIVVTAQRREENLQRAALPVQAVTKEQIARSNVISLTDLERLIPSVQIENQNGPFITFAIRGVASSDLNEFGSPAIAIGVDGVYLPRGTSPQGVFYDVARVEVLKGPQGTLYGRNSAAGAVNIITNAPQLGDYGGDVSISGGNYNLLSVTGDVNVPLGDTLAARLAFQVVNRGGYFSDGTGDDKHESARLSLKWVPNDRLTVLLRADYMHLGGEGAGQTGWCTGTAAYLTFGGYNPSCGADGRFWNPGNPWQSVVAQAPAQLLNAATGPFALASGMILNPAGQAPGLYWPVYNHYSFTPDAFVPVNPVSAKPYVNNQNVSVSGQIDYSMLGGDLTVIPAYRHEQVNFLSTATGDTIREINSTTQATFEARFASDSQRRFRYILGAFYDYDDQPGQPDYDTEGYVIPPPLFSSYFYNSEPTEEVETTHTSGWSAAAFANGTFSITDSLRLTGGLRFTHDQRNSENTGINAVNFYIPTSAIQTTFPTGPGATDGNGTVLLPSTPLPYGTPITTANAVPDIFSASGSHAWDNVSWKTGLEWDAAPTSLLYASAASGYKAGGFFNAPAGYTNVFQPEQLTAYTIGSKNLFFDKRLQANLELFYWDYRNQQVYSFILDGPILVFSTQNAQQATSKGAEFDGRYLLTDNTLLTLDVQYTDAYYNKYTVAAAFPPGCPLISGDMYNCSGGRLLNSPTWTVGFGAQQTFPLAAGGSFVLGMNGKSESSYPGASLNAYAMVPANVRIDANLTYYEPKGRWSIEAWVENIGNIATPLGAGGAFGGSEILGTSVRPPRTFGMTLGAHF